MRTSLIGLGLITCLAAAHAAPPQPPATHVYKTVDGVKIELDVYNFGTGESRPLLVWIHGGGLITGDRRQVPGDLRTLCVEQGIVLASIDYRLAPEVKVGAIVEDVADSVKWLRGHAAELHIDPAKVVIAGGSAGGFLTINAGVHVTPRPRALVAYWGYGEIGGPWSTEPELSHGKEGVTLEEVSGGVNRGVITGMYGSPDLSKQRGAYYAQLRRTGKWAWALTGLDPAKDQAKIDPWCPVKHITPDYPPILMVHGTADLDVPYEQSAMMARELKRAGVEHELVSVEGAGHGLSGGDKQAVAAAREKALAFIVAQLR